MNMIQEWVEKHLRPMIAEAYAQGYRDASDDVCRRLKELYSFGFELGKIDAQAEIGEITIDDLEEI